MEAAGVYSVDSDLGMVRENGDLGLACILPWAV